MTVGQRSNRSHYSIGCQPIHYHVGRVLSQLFVGDPMGDRHDVESGVTCASDIVGSVADDDGSTGIERDAVLSREATSNDGWQLEPIPRVRSEPADVQIEVGVEASNPQLDFRSHAEVAGEHSLNEAVIMQGRQRLCGTRIRRLVAGKLSLTLRHDLCQLDVEPSDPALCQLGSNPRTDGRVHDNRFVGVAVHSFPREGDILLSNVIRASHRSAEPTKVRRNQRAVNVPHDQTGPCIAHVEDCRSVHRAVMSSQQGAYMRTAGEQDQDRRISSTVADTGPSASTAPDEPVGTALHVASATLTCGTNASPSCTGTLAHTSAISAPQRLSQRPHRDSSGVPGTHEPSSATTAGPEGPIERASAARRWPCLRNQRGDLSLALALQDEAVRRRTPARTTLAWLLARRAELHAKGAATRRR